MRNADFTADRADVDDASCFFLTHRRQHGHDRVEWSPEVRLHCELEIFVRHHFQGSDLNDACVVDEHIDASEARVDIRHHRHHVVPVRHVATRSYHFSTKLFEIESRLFELLFVACAEYETRPFARELARHHEAEASRATRSE